MNNNGLYSKAAQIIRSLPQEKGSAEQMIGAARKIGLKQTEIDNAKPPVGPITRDALAKHFEDSLPKISVAQYGENPNFMNRDESKQFMGLQNKMHREGLTGDEKTTFNRMLQRVHGAPNYEMVNSDDQDEEDQPANTEYSDYQLPGGKNYRERLLQLNVPKDPRNAVQAKLDKARRMQGAWPSDHPQSKAAAAEADSLQAKLDSMPERTHQPPYQSTHWSEHPNVLAHIRMTDRNADGKRLLHVEELQSDWAQEGRDQGFHDYKNPYEIFDTATGRTVSKHPTYGEMWDKFRSMPDEQSRGLDYGSARDRPPAAPYVQNTQHWTDLALKNVLREAALGNYDGVVFTPGQAQADRYGLEKQLDKLQYDPAERSLRGFKDGTSIIHKTDVEASELPSLIGKDMTTKLMHPDNTGSTPDGNPAQELNGDDLKMGGQGMKGYYDQIVPKSVMQLARQHDPQAQPGQPVQMGDYQGFHLPMTDTMKNSILDKGFSAMRRGGRVARADGGNVGDNFANWFGNSVTHTDGQPHVFYTGTSKDKDFTSFNVGRHGAWFTRDPEVASQYADTNDSQGYKADGWNMVNTNTASRVIPAYVKAENPYTGEYGGQNGSNYKALQSAWFDTLRAKGHDAWIPASSDGNLAVVLKEPQQIKSVYNNGNFDPNQKHMGKAEGGPIEGTYNEQAPAGNSQTGTQALGLLGSGGVRGGDGVLPAPVQASGEEDLIGLPSWVHHEGAEDFIKPHERKQMEDIYRQYNGPVSKALHLTRRFTKDGNGATMALKSKGK